MSTPRVGIALALYRPDAVYLAEQLESIVAQTLPSWHCVLSSDSPLAEIRGNSSLARYFEDPRFTFVENAERLGARGNFERAMRLCADLGVRYIACADQDDVWYPHKLAVSVETLDQLPALSLVHSDLDLLIDAAREAGSAWQFERRVVAHVLPSQLLVRNVVSGCSMTLDAELIRLYPSIPSSVDYHDHWYALVSSWHGGVHAIEQPLLAYRQHANNAVGARRVAGTADALVEEVPAIGVGPTLERCRTAFRRSRQTLDFALDAGAPVRRHERWAFGRFDLGALLLVQGLRALRRDPSLARSSLVRAAGKLLVALEPR